MDYILLRLPTTLRQLFIAAKSTSKTASLQNNFMGHLQIEPRSWNAVNSHILPRGASSANCGNLFRDARAKNGHNLCKIYCKACKDQFLNPLRTFCKVIRSKLQGVVMALGGIRMAFDRVKAAQMQMRVPIACFVINFEFHSNATRHDKLSALHPRLSSPKPSEIVFFNDATSHAKSLSKSTELGIYYCDC